MKIKQVTSQHCNDYIADMECEHCGNLQVDRLGYADSYYHQHVIPAMCCQKCGKNRAGVIKEASKKDEAS